MTRTVLNPKCDPVVPVNVTVALRLATGTTGVGLADGVGHGVAVRTGVGVGVSVDVARFGRVKIEVKGDCSLDGKLERSYTLSLRVNF